jgi:hypothetical protein
MLMWCATRRSMGNLVDAQCRAYLGVAQNRSALSADKNRRGLDGR